MTASTVHTFTMTEERAELIHQLANSHCQALKNWIVSAIEQGSDESLGRARDMVAELRDHEAIFAGFNMEAKREVAKLKKEPIITAHTLR